MSEKVPTPDLMVLFNEAEAAEYLGYKQGYLRKLRHLRKGPRYLRLGGRNGSIRYTSQALNDYVSDAEVSW